MWTAGRNFPEQTSRKYISNLAGTLKDDTQQNLQLINHPIDLTVELPDSFDPRDKWSKCTSLNEIRDQGACASCWAVAAVAAMTDRYCIFSKEKQQFHFSAEDLISCCETCGLGCVKGLHFAAWDYWTKLGLVSGGNYNSSEGCKPYNTPPGENFVTEEMPSSSRIVDISSCKMFCESSYNVKYRNDKRYGDRAYIIERNENQIKIELYFNGPVEGVMEVYTDFLNYKYGVYNYTEGESIGHHSIKILGWGEEHGHKYWLVANTWGKGWGDEGFFKIIRGVNHCGIEDSIVAGEPIIFSLSLKKKVYKF
ncbi:hypothetical protein HF086_004045 [Spodoptera exigua]|uniref:Peptidase C1A papain C-terminal domain-containing protein n=1 Tax=Spodoptera exigua TaxID=7107 RepID=A0A922SD43_SPOEX|nr:hypothetical protein HF086_004045 [Spodoptera exigua]